MSSCTNYLGFPRERNGNLHRAIHATPEYCILTDLCKRICLYHEKLRIIAFLLNESSISKRNILCCKHSLRISNGAFSACISLWAQKISPFQQNQSCSVVICICFISPLDLKGARALCILSLLILYILLMLEMLSLAPCVWPQLAFSCFCCSKTTITLSIICTGNRQPWNDFICKPHWHQVTHISHAGADASSQTITSAGSSFWPAASEILPC